MGYSPEVQDGIQRYLDDIERHLTHVSTAKRSELLEDIQCHIHEALLDHSSDPSLDDLQQVLAGMDPPSAYEEVIDSGYNPNVNAAPTEPISAQRPDLEHNIVLGVVLTIITCGLYDLYWNYRQMVTCNELLGRQEFSFWIWLLLCIITCGLWHIYYQYQMGRAIVELQRKQSHHPFDALPIIGVLLTVIALPIVVDAMHQHELNKLI